MSVSERFTILSGQWAVSPITARSRPVGNDSPPLTWPAGGLQCDWSCLPS